MNDEIMVRMKRERLCVAVVQLTSGGDVERNISRALKLSRQAIGCGAELVMLPESFAFLGGESEQLRYAQTIETSTLLNPIRELARECGVGLIAGSIPESSGDDTRIYNTTVVVGRNGDTLAAYRKIHLFDVDIPGEVSLRESGTVMAGEEPVCVNFEGWRIGLSICYDLRFPELYRQLNQQGAHVFVVPSAFTLQTGKDHWEVLLRARAIENQCYVAAPAQFGRHGSKRVSWGKSMLVDPWGLPIAVSPECESIALGFLDPDYQDSIRQQLPCADHRRLGS